MVNADDWSLGRHMAQWIAETLKGKGNIVMIAGIAGASPAENRIKAAHEVFDTYPDIKILDLQYTDWSPAKGQDGDGRPYPEIRQTDRRRLE